MRMRHVLLVLAFLPLCANGAWPQPTSRADRSMREIPRTELVDKLQGAWVGQMVGVSYGSVYEFHYQGRIMEDPIREWRPEFLENAIGQDDLYVEMTFLEALTEYGLDVTYEEAGKAFAETEYGLWHANRYGRENCRNGVMPPLSGDPKYNAHFDDIDYQIEADYAGIICPGLPQAANRVSEVFGRVMNWGDGLYGGMWVGAMYSEAYFSDDVEGVVTRALGAIPAESTYAMLIRDVIDQYHRDPDDWRACWRMLEEKWGQVDLCPEGRGGPFNIDAKLNGGYIAIGLLYGEGDFAKTLEISTRCGQDNDCNPANAAGVLGAMLGLSGIPTEYTSYIPKLQDQVFVYTAYSFSALTDVCLGLAREIVDREGGEIVEHDGAEVWRIPVQAPTAPPLEQYIDVGVWAGLTATATPRGVRLAWSPVPHARRYAVLRSEGGDVGWKRIGVAGAETNAYLDRAAKPGKAYRYVLRADLAVRGVDTTPPVVGGIVDPVATNEPSPENFALAEDAWADALVLGPTGSGLKDVDAIRNGVREENYDSFNGAVRGEDDWYAIRFLRAKRVNEVVYTEGKSFDNGGWWLSLGVEALDPVTMEWSPIEGAAFSPAYDFTDSQTGRAPYTVYTFRFPTVVCAGVRVAGKPGGERTFTSIGELEAYLTPR